MGVALKPFFRRVNLSVNTTVSAKSNFHSFVVRFFKCAQHLGSHVFCLGNNYIRIIPLNFGFLSCKNTSRKCRYIVGTFFHHEVHHFFTHDRPGLLYTIARTLFELNLSVASARIGTYLDQVVDVFYVTDSGGMKVEGEGHHQQIRSALLTAIESASASRPR